MSLGVLNMFTCTLEGAFNCHQQLPLKYQHWQLCQMQYYILLAPTTILDTILFQLIIAKLLGQKVCFGGLVRIYTCIMLDLVGACRQYGANNWWVSQGHLTCWVGANNTMKILAPTMKILALTKLSVPMNWNWTPTETEGKNTLVERTAGLFDQLYIGKYSVWHLVELVGITWDILLSSKNCVTVIFIKKL